MAASYAFPKAGRLSGRSATASLFAEGRKTFVHPFRIVHSKERTAPGQAPEVLFSVPKRRFKKAVHRNRLRRQLKECYRLELPALMERGRNLPLHLAFLYTIDEALPFDELRRRLVVSLERLSAEAAPSPPAP